MTADLSSTRPVLSEELHAYVDGQLPAARLAAVEAHLAANPADAARVKDWQAQREGLRVLYDAALAEPLPPRLTEALQAQAARPWLPAAVRIAAGLALLLAGSGVGWGLRGAVSPPQVAADTGPALVRPAADAHRLFVAEIRHPVEVRAAEAEHLVGWLSKRLGQPLRVPVLDTAGFALMGGRLLPGGEGRAAAQFMYEDGSGRRLTLYVRPVDSGQPVAFRFAAEDGLSMFTWVDPPLGYALAGEIDRAGLLTVANAVYAQLSR